MMDLVTPTVTNHDYLIGNDGACQVLSASSQPSNGDPSSTAEMNGAVNSEQPYRLYRFLTDLEDIIHKHADDRSQLLALCPLVRRLLASSSWLELSAPQPAPGKAWGVSILYDEPFFPITVQLVTWQPGATSPIHNHGGWGIVALLSGQEKNRFWRRLHNPVDPTSQAPEYPHQIEAVGDRLVLPGDIITFLPDAIHSVEALGDAPTVSFNVYGPTQHDQRLQYNPQTHDAVRF
ncbi:MAG: cupin [Kaiparowitsia implicata GSE-PSE-MK54-09C]|nr:cupin [Kaiparowitsia implicata GSE-PSE-MK54-09C]